MATRGAQIAVQAQAESVVFAVWCYPRTWSHNEDWRKYLLAAVVKRHQEASNYRFTLDSLDGGLPLIVGDGRGRAGDMRKELKEAITASLCARLECQLDDIRGLKHVLKWFVARLNAG